MKKISLLTLATILTLVSCGPTSISVSEAMNIANEISDYILTTSEKPAYAYSLKSMANGVTVIDVEGAFDFFNLYALIKILRMMKLSVYGYMLKILISTL